jgi:Lon protease-like protein
MTERIERFPLFPLGLVLLPGELLPLHIFEERYKLMIGECLEEEREFGIIWLADDALKDVGCAASVTQVLERFEDGRLNVAVQGTTPFRLDRRIGDLPYPAGDIMLLDDEPATDEAALERARASYADLVEHVTDERPEAEALSKLGAYGMAATLDIAPAAKQALLELRSEPARLEQLEALFAETLNRIKTAAHVAEQASGNGHVNPREQSPPGQD